MLPLRKILSNKRSGKSGSLSSAEMTSAPDDFGTPETVQVAPCHHSTLHSPLTLTWSPHPIILPLYLPSVLSLHSVTRQSSCLTLLEALIRGRLGHDDAGQQHCVPPAEGMCLLMAQVTIDNCTSSNYSVVSIMCKDRKGLIYDLMRTLKDIHVRVAYAKIKVHGEMAETDLFVEEADGQRMKERCAEHLPCSVSSLRTQESRLSSTEVLRLLEACALACRAS